MIVIVSPADDVHYRCVAEELKRMGRPVALLDTTELGRGATMTIDIGSRQSERWSAQRPLDLREASSIWFRRIFPPELQPAPSAAADLAWVQRSWTEAFESLLSLLPGRFISDPAAQHRARLKPRQLRIARELGLRVPETVMTNDAQVAREFIERHHGEVVHKVVKTPRDRFAGTIKWSPAHEGELEWLYLEPIFFQERIAAPTELRITIIGRRIFAAEFTVGKDVIDARREIDRPFVPKTLPRAVEAQLYALMDGLGLSYATIDMKLKSDGEYVFLELNPQGQFLYVEIKSGMPLTRAMAELLAGPA